ncbi:MAG: nitrite/sulfite reductase [Gammaproteobacteria bacterium]|nr:nitrite/sulfite reductase [Gammaproteobacteria bacterium]
MSKDNIWVEQEELVRYREAVATFERGDMDEARFQATRLQQGIYGQRQDGVHMIRIKLPGGQVSAAQLHGVADVLAKYSPEDMVSITTRQDLQLHSIPLTQTPAAVEQLAELGLTSREACGNTVRNVTACPLAGVCPAECTNVQPLVEAVSKRFLRHPLTQHLPRKFKMSFSGCESDCAQGMFHDLAVIALQREGRNGFRVLAGGGLGHKPRHAIVVEEFVEERELLPVIEAVLALHHRHSDRKRRARARLKFLVERLTPEGFLEKYREELVRTGQVYAHDALPTGEWSDAENPEKSFTGAAGAPRTVLEQKQRGHYVVPVSLPLGDLNVNQLRGLAELLQSRSLSEARVTQDQNLVLLHIPKTELNPVQQDLEALGLGTPKAGDDVVSCPGTWTCRLGITASRTLCEQLDGGDTDLRIRVSGCHNGCAQPYVGDIGLHGEGRRHYGKLIPSYRFHLGGEGCAGGDIATKGPEIPALRASAAITRIKQAFADTRQENDSFRQWTQRQAPDYFNTLLEDLVTVTAFDVETLSQDVGEAQNFRVLALGGGECAGASEDAVSSRFSEAAHEREYRRVFHLARKPEQALDCAEAIARLVGESLLNVNGVSVMPESLTEIGAEISRVLTEQKSPHAYIAESLAVFTQELARLRVEFDEPAFERLTAAQDLWTALVAELCVDVDLGDFLPSVEPVAQAV